MRVQRVKALGESDGRVIQGPATGGAQIGADQQIAAGTWLEARHPIRLSEEVDPRDEATDIGYAVGGEQRRLVHHHDRRRGGEEDDCRRHIRRQHREVRRRRQAVGEQIILRDRVARGGTGRQQGARQRDRPAIHAVRIRRNQLVTANAKLQPRQIVRFQIEPHLRYVAIGIDHAVGRERDLRWLDHFARRHHQARDRRKLIDARRTQQNAFRRRVANDSRVVGGLESHLFRRETRISRRVRVSDVANQRLNGRHSGLVIEQHFERVRAHAAGERAEWNSREQHRVREDADLAAAHPLIADRQSIVRRVARDHARHKAAIEEIRRIVVGQQRGGIDKLRRLQPLIPGGALPKIDSRTAGGQAAADFASHQKAEHGFGGVVRAEHHLAQLVARDARVHRQRESNPRVHVHDGGKRSRQRESGRQR